MLLKGEYIFNEERLGIYYFGDTSNGIEVIVLKDGLVWSAYKREHEKDGSLSEYSYNNKKAQEISSLIDRGLRGCTAKNSYPIVFELGTASCHEFTRGKVKYIVAKYGKELVEIEIQSEVENLRLTYESKQKINIDIPYIKLTTIKEVDLSDDEEDIPVRSLEEISLYKDITWLKDKKYYIVNDDETAEKIFEYLDNYDGAISYDTETTGLKINMFGKVNSKWEKELEEWNRDKEKGERIVADKLVGIIFCVEAGISYYFPCGNRKFKNIYEDKGSKVRQELIKKIKSQYIIGEYREATTDMARYWREVAIDDVRSDCLLMERCRKILSLKHIVAHNGSFEWKVSWLYDIVINLLDDTMLMHQLMYKFRSTTANAGEPSNLKYLAKVELGIDQLDLEDFFIGYKEDSEGTVRGNRSKSYHRKKQNIKIDFSYMDYQGTKAYAPADGDITLQLYYKYKRDMMKNHKEMEYIYNVEVIVASAVGYMEFYGHRIDENKIEQVKEANKKRLTELEHLMRVEAKLSTTEEDEVYRVLKELNIEIEEYEDKLQTIGKEIEQIKSGIKEGDIKDLEDRKREIQEEYDSKGLGSLYDEVHEKLIKTIVESENPINFASPAQVTKLFFEHMKIPFDSDKPSVGKKVLKGYAQKKDEDGKAKYPIIILYSEWKKISTLLTKFFDKLQDFMYPGGYIFSSFGQIATATGRMSCKKPNAQQYPKDITKIVIPRDNYIMLDADYSQIEYRTLVAMADEPGLKEQFKDPDADYHTMMASRMFGVPYSLVDPKMRSDAKSFNFGIPYGMGFKSLAILLTGLSGPEQVEEAKEKYELYFKDQPNVRRFFDQVKEMAQVNRYTKTYWKRHRYYSFEDKDGQVNNARKASALRQAGNAVIQGTAADIFKIAVARNYIWIKNRGLLGKVIIVNMIHDEQLIEIDVTHVNIQVALRDILYNMEFKVDNFPPLYVGAGIGKSWKDAKGKMAEIHPVLANILSNEVKDKRLDDIQILDPDEIIRYFDKRVYDFRLQKIRDYVLDPENRNKPLHPVIGNLLNLQFTYGLEGKYSGDELTNAALRKFIEDNKLPVDVEWFITDNMVEIEEEKDDGYEDEEEDIEEGYEEEDIGTFAVIDESNKLYGSTAQDIIQAFGVVVSKELGICGIDIRVLSYRMKDKLGDYLAEHQVERDTVGGVEVVFLCENNTLYRTGVKVANVTGRDLVKQLGLKLAVYN